MTNPDKVVCVFCGSSAGTSPAYTQAAEQLGQLLVASNWGLVYGGGTTGLMGSVAKSVAGAGGYVHGIIPKALLKKEAQGVLPDPQNYGHTTLVDDMHTRKRLMGQEAHAFIALPGGFGTAEELFEVTTWNQLGIHEYPIILLNINGFYDGLNTWIDKAINEGFIREGNRGIVITVDTPQEAIEAIKQYKVADDRLDLDWSDQSPIRER